MKKYAVVSLSGGMDSSTLLLKLLAEGYNVTALSFDYGQKHKVELERATELVKYINSTLIKVEGVTDKLKKDLQELHGLDAATLVEKVKQENGPVKHQVIKLDGLSQLLNSTLVEGGSEVPEGHYAEENMKGTVVPNRNKIFSSIIQAVALSIAEQNNAECSIAMGIHAGDHCFSRDTKIMTPDGIKNFQDLKIGDKIFSFNFQTNEMEEDILTHIEVKNKVSTINVIETAAGNIKLTDEHNVFRVKLENFHPVHGYDKSFEKVKVKELRKGDFMVSSINSKILKPALVSTLDLSGYELEVNRGQTSEMLDLLPIVDSLVATDSTLKVCEKDNMIICLSNGSKLKECPRFVNKEHFYRIVAWYITEGWTNIPTNKSHSRYSSGISQSLKANFTKVDSIVESLKISGIPYKLQFSKKQFNEKPQEMTVYLSGVISLILQSCGKKSIEKTIPQWLYNDLITNKEFVLPFFETMIAGDGYQALSHISYISKSKSLIEKMSFLGNILGYGIAITKPKGVRTTYSLSFLSPQNKIAATCLGEGKFNYISSIKQEEYNDNVFDITVKNNHNFFAGEFGQVLISNSIYPDCRQEFRDADFEAFKQGNWGSEKVHIYTPYLHTDKFGILEDGLKCCEQLNLDFNEVYKRTNTSYKPIFIPKPKSEIVAELNIKVSENHKTTISYKEPVFIWQLHQDAEAFGVQTGKWYSDYKSASSVERIEAFIKLGKPDPCEYADESGSVNWETVVKHVETVLKEHNNK